MEKIFSKTRIFEGKNEKEIKKILEKIVVIKKKIKKQEFFMLRGDKVIGLMLVIDGKLGALMPKENGEIHKIETFTNGDIVASAFVFSKNNNIPVDLLAEEKSEVVIIDKMELLKLFKENTDILVNFLNEISSKTQFLTTKIWKYINNRTIEEKMRDYIFENSENGVFEIKSITELAEIFNTTRPSLSRVLKKMITKKIIEKTGRNKFRVI